jgi:hypothetical protein
VAESIDFLCSLPKKRYQRARPTPDGVDHIGGTSHKKLLFVVETVPRARRRSKRASVTAANRKDYASPCKGRKPFL